MVRVRPSSFTNFLGENTYAPLTPLQKILYPRRHWGPAKSGPNSEVLKELVFKRGFSVV